MPNPFEKRPKRNSTPVKTPVQLPRMKTVWVFAMIPGVLLWIAALALWSQGTLDERVLFYFNSARVARNPLVLVSQWLTGYGMPAITVLYLVYLVGSLRLPRWNAPRTIYLYVIFSFGLSGIAGDLLKLVFARPRPMAVFSDQIVALSQATSQAIPSGHTTKALALALPLLFLISSRPGIHKVLKGLAVSLALGVAFSRIVLGAHYLSDVIAGVGMALVGFPFSMLLAHKVLKRIDAEQLPSLAKKWAIILAGLTIAFMFL